MRSRGNILSWLYTYCTWLKLMISWTRPTEPTHILTAFLTDTFTHTHIHIHYNLFIVTLSIFFMALNVYSGALEHRSWCPFFTPVRLANLTLETMMMMMKIYDTLGKSGYLVYKCVWCAASWVGLGLIQRVLSTIFFSFVFVSIFKLHAISPWSYQDENLWSENECSMCARPEKWWYSSSMLSHDFRSLYER